MRLPFLNKVPLTTIGPMWTGSNYFSMLIIYNLTKIGLQVSLDGFDLSTVHIQNSKEKKISAESGFELGAAGWEARMLPLCYAASPDLDLPAAVLVDLVPADVHVLVRKHPEQEVAKVMD